MDIASRPSDPLNQQTADAATPPHDPATIRREDYRPPDWLVPEVSLDFALGLDETAVTAKLSVRRNPQGSAEKTLRLNGDGLPRAR
jgi:aminopeptidase N